MGELMGEYTVTVALEGEDVLTFQGYAENVTDALYKAINKRDEELLAGDDDDG